MRRRWWSRWDITVEGGTGRRYKWRPVGAGEEVEWWRVTVTHRRTGASAYAVDWDLMTARREAQESARDRRDHVMSNRRSARLARRYGYRPEDTPHIHDRLGSDA